MCHTAHSSTVSHLALRKQGLEGKQYVCLFCQISICFHLCRIKSSSCFLERNCSFITMTVLQAVRSLPGLSCTSNERNALIIFLIKPRSSLLALLSSDNAWCVCQRAKCRDIRRAFATSTQRDQRVIVLPYVPLKNVFGRRLCQHHIGPRAPSGKTEM